MFIWSHTNRGFVKKEGSISHEILLKTPKNTESNNNTIAAKGWYTEYSHQTESKKEGLIEQ